MLEIKTLLSIIRQLSCWCLLLGFLPAQLVQAAQHSSQENFDALSLSELMDIHLTVTSVGRKPQQASLASAAIYIVTQEDMHALGANSIPEALRLVPGLHVARFGGYGWAISSRGFNSRFSQRLQVLVDGREIYSDLFNSVVWELNDIPLNLVERIEVIRGPGTALWGANAVNGVINIITVPVDQVQPNASVLLEEGHYKLSATQKYQNDEKSWQLSAQYARGTSEDYYFPSPDHEFYTTRLGLKHHVQLSETDSFRLDIAGMRISAFDNALLPPTFPGPLVAQPADTVMESLYILGNWTRQHSPSSATFLQLSMNYFKIGYFNTTGSISSKSGNIVLSAQHRFEPIDFLDWIVGGDIKVLGDRFHGQTYLSFSPEEQVNYIVSAFTQGDFHLSDDTTLTAGARLEYTSLLGFKLQPNIRLVYQLDKEHTLWAALLVAHRLPTRFDQNTTIYREWLLNSQNQPILHTSASGASLPVLRSIVGNPSFQSEKANSLELGIRLQPEEQLTLDMAAYYTRHDRLRSLEVGNITETTSGYAIQPLSQFNFGAAETYGFEGSLDWKASEKTRLKLSYTYFRYHSGHELGQDTSFLDTTVGAFPRQQIGLLATHQWKKNVFLDLLIRDIDNIEVLGLERYTTTDVQMRFTPSENTELRLAVKNITDERHLEFKNGYFDFFSPTYLDRRYSVVFNYEF